MDNKTLSALIIALCVLALIVLSWVVFNDGPPPAEIPVVAEQNEPEPAPQPILREPPPPVAEPAEPVAMPAPAPKPVVVEAPITLDGSDELVLEAVADLSSTLGQWLLPREQIRKWVLAVDIIAEGKLPKRYRPIDYPVGKFKTIETDQNIVLDQSNYQRSDTLIAVLIAIEPAKLANYYQQWLPLLEKAYREQGKPYTFDSRFKQAISQVLAVSPQTETPVLVHPSVLYKYADEKLEKASDIEKLLWRMGPDNAEELQGYLREIRYQLEQ